MNFRWIKIFRKGPLRTTLTKNGIGVSWGIPGFRFGYSPSGTPFISIGIPGTGLYWIKYLKPKNSSNLTNENQSEGK